MYEKFPTGHYAERAAWKIGWWAYRNAQLRRDRARLRGRGGELPAIGLPSAVAVLVGARARGAARAGARRGALRAGRDRLSQQLLRPARQSKRLDTARPVKRRRRRRDPESGSAPADAATNLPATAPLPPNEAVVRALLGLELYDQALDELHYAQKVWGDSSAIQATIGWIYYRRGELRAGINVMKRAYPQYLAAGGEKLPPRAAQGAVPDRLLAADQALLERAPARSVRGRGADRAGVDLHRRRQVGGERLRADAAAAVHRPAVRAAAAPAEVLARAC